MSRFHRVLGIGMILLALVAGCPGEDGEGGSYRYLLNVEGGEVSIEYFESFTGWGYEPSALWKLDLATGEARAIQEPVPQSDLQVAGGYYVTGEVSDDEILERIVVVQISTGQKTIIAERPDDPDAYWWPTRVLAAGQVAFVNSDQLVIFDLAAGEIVRTFDVPAGRPDLVAFDGRRALVTYYPNQDNYDWTVAAYLLDVTTGEGAELPLAPGESQPYYFDARFSGDWLAMSRWEDEVGEEVTTRTQVLLYHIPTMTWRVLGDFGQYVHEYVNQYSPEIPFVNGFVGQSVVVEHYRLGFLDSFSRIELIGVDSGASRLISETTGGLYLTPRSPVLTRDGLLYWIEAETRALVRHDVETGQEQTFPINIP